MASDTESAVSEERLRICRSSAEFWVNALPRYADRNQRLADRFAIASGTVSALTGLSIWSSLTHTSSYWSKAIVSAAALIAAMLALVPRIKNYADNAGQARELSSRYGNVLGKLIDLTAPVSGDSHVMGAAVTDPEVVRSVIAEFQATKEKKDALRNLPDRPKS